MAGRRRKMLLFCVMTASLWQGGTKHMAVALTAVVIETVVEVVSNGDGTLVTSESSSIQ